MTDSERGTLDVRGRAVVRIAEIAATRVTGVERVDGGLAGRGLPRAEATVHQGRVRATVDAATRWPTPIADVAVRVRSAIETELARTSGLEVESIDVRLQYLSPDSAARSRRVE